VINLALTETVNLAYYIKNFVRNSLPSAFFKKKYDYLKAFEATCDSSEIRERLDYYFKKKTPFPIPEQAVAVRDFKRTKGTGYYFDLKAFLHFFKKNTRFAYRFGDDTSVLTYPFLVKARPVQGDIENAVLFKLNKRRHFKWVHDHRQFADKKDILVWRGGAYKPLRQTFVKAFWNHPLCDIGQTNNPLADEPWQKAPLSIDAQLDCKFIFCPEGNDVATNLKWAMSSNSLCFMPKPTCETWFMEGILEAGIHYVEVAKDGSDLEEKIKYYISHTDEALSIIENAHAHVARFQNEHLEDLLCLKVLERYAEFSGQMDAEKFK
jgi:hypothetical protein